MAEIDEPTERAEVRIERIRIAANFGEHGVSAESSGPADGPGGRARTAMLASLAWTGSDAVMIGLVMTADGPAWLVATLATACVVFNGVILHRLMLAPGGREDGHGEGDRRS
ncbi:hypothetical protein [Actinomadura macrotermitis]|uniref:Uncharacterized protein n=1 Tax=Actinomadura macrotermitis TaxID=2585200 RepID=A0A7K0C0N5_9ACTN|nr:hypothetical protein [Actinomadura macrotermitis]MQY07035.1 hypothetical protein [Actinomadura macrotermitis]